MRTKPTRVLQTWKFDIGYGVPYSYGHEGDILYQALWDTRPGSFSNTT
jgi:hypothetical protein